MADIRDRIKSKIGARTPVYKGPPVSSPPSPPNPSDRLRSAVDRAKGRIAELPKTPQAAGAQGLDYMRNTMVPQLTQAGQSRFPNVPVSQGTPVNFPGQGSPVNPNQQPNADRGLIISWIKNQPAFQWLQNVLAQYGIDLNEITPRPAPGNPVPGSPMGTIDTGGSPIYGSASPFEQPAQPGGLTSNPYQGPTNSSGFYNPGF